MQQPSILFSRLPICSSASMICLYQKSRRWCTWSSRSPFSSIPSFLWAHVCVSLECCTVAQQSVFFARFGSSPYGVTRDCLCTRRRLELLALSHLFTPNPGLSIPPRSCHRVRWSQLPSILCFGLLSSLLAPVNGSPLTFSPQPGASQRGGMSHVQPSSICFSLVFTLRLPTGSSCSSGSGSASLQCVLPSRAFNICFRFPLALLSGMAFYGGLHNTNCCFSLFTSPNFGGSSLSSWFRCIAVCSAEHMRPSHSGLSTFS
jgi:hypothetical protein